MLQKWDRRASTNDLHQSSHDTIRLPKLGGEGGNYLQLMSWITDPMTSITEDKTTLFALVTSPIFHNLLWLHTSAKTNWASFKLNSLRYVLVWKSLKCSMFHFSSGVWLQTIQTHLHLRPIMPPCIYCGNSPILTGTVIMKTGTSSIVHSLYSGLEQTEIMICIFVAKLLYCSRCPRGRRPIQ